LWYIIVKEGICMMYMVCSSTHVTKKTLFTFGKLKVKIVRRLCFLTH